MPVCQLLKFFLIECFFLSEEWKTEDYSSHLADVIINKLKSETETSLSESEDEG